MMSCRVIQYNRSPSKTRNNNNNQHHQQQQQHQQHLNRKFWDFTQPPDVILQVENEDIYAHRTLLVKASPVFAVMLESDHFIEKNLPKIKLPFKRIEEIQQLLNFVYPFGHQISDGTNFQSLLDLSREYQINEIKALCEVHLLLKPPTVDQLIIAEEYDLNNLREKCLKELSEKALNGLQDHPRFCEISDKTRLVIMEQQLKRLQLYCKNISQITTATDVRNMPIITHVNCGHRPKNCNNPHFICQVCRASALRSYVKGESWKLGLDKKSF